MKTTNIFFLIATVAVLVGAFMKFNSIEYSFFITLLGLLLGVIASLLYISNLKKTKKNLEKK